MKKWTIFFLLFMLDLAVLFVLITDLKLGLIMLAIYLGLALFLLKPIKQYLGFD